jgi:2-polyprenyl-3-methyl-5-hydroxy-6-metoxy-1,4-benzoquinol methylase
MKVYPDLNQVDDYIRQAGKVQIGEMEQKFENTLRRIKKYKEIHAETRILEVGTGTGWFPILCKKKGIHCDGLEISPQLVEYAKNFGRKYGIEPNIQLGNIEEVEIGVSAYDIIIALSTFEHVEHWQIGMQRIFHALKPGGLFYFYSTNKFSFWSGEYSFPFYGWLPNKWRYRLRIIRQGEDIMKLGIDFNQFNHFQLNRFFRELGFSKIFDQFEVIDSENMIQSQTWKNIVLEIVKQFKILRQIALLFSPGTLFVCKK